MTTRSGGSVRDSNEAKGGTRTILDSYSEEGSEAEDETKENMNSDSSNEDQPVARRTRLKRKRVVVSSSSSSEGPAAAQGLVSGAGASPRIVRNDVVYVVLIMWEPIRLPFHLSMLSLHLCARGFHYER